MPLFKINDNKLSLVRSNNFNYEKDLQKVIENNLETVFNCRFVATEFTTGSNHAGRIDSLAISEDGNPVIIEYKKVESSDLLNQSLFYLSWLNDHKGDFQVAATNKLGSDLEIDWSDIRVICLAPGFKKYDLHAVKMMGAGIELWKYKLYEDGTFFIEEVFGRNQQSMNSTGKNPVMVEAGKKAALARANNTYSMEEHLNKVEECLSEIVAEIRDYTLSLDESVEEVPKKHYIAYKLNQNFLCMEIQKKKILIFLKINMNSDNFKMPINGRDVSSIGHFGTGNFELSIADSGQIEEVKSWINKSFVEIGG